MSQERWQLKQVLKSVVKHRVQSHEYSLKFTERRIDSSRTSAWCSLPFLAQSYVPAEWSAWYCAPAVARAVPHPSLAGDSQPSRQLCSERNAKQRGRELSLQGMETAPRPEFGQHLSLLLYWWKFLAAALLENNFLLYSNIVVIMPLRN